MFLFDQGLCKLIETFNTKVSVFLTWARGCFVKHFPMELGILSYSRLASLATIFLIAYCYLGVRVLFKSLSVAPKSITWRPAGLNHSLFNIGWYLQVGYQQGHLSKAYVWLWLYDFGLPHYPWFIQPSMKKTALLGVSVSFQLCKKDILQKCSLASMDREMVWHLEHGSEAVSPACTWAIL